MGNTSDWKNNKTLGTLLSAVGIGVWDWNLATAKVTYSDAWAKILGYAASDLPQVVETWERMLLPEDLDYANKQIAQHLSGESPMYEAEFRMRCKDGSIVWAQDKGQVSERDKDGRPIRFMGVLQNVNRLKNTELQLLEKQETLDLAVQVASLGTWDWDISGDFIRYNDEYLNMLGLTQSDVTGSMQEWEVMNHPEDLPRSLQLLDAYLAGDIPAYECEIRMHHRDGSYIWTRDVGKIVARDADGKPSRLIGGHLNIDALKRSKMELKEALGKLSSSNSYLTDQMEHRNKELLEQDKMLWTVNQISRRLLAFQSTENFENLVQDCLRMLGESINKNRIYIWKDRLDAQGARSCTQIYEWVRNVAPIQGNKDYEEIPYASLPAFSNATENDCCLNSRLCDLAESEQDILAPQGIKTILIAPIAVNGGRWGFIGVDNCETEQLFTSVEENMLMMSGSMLANTIEKIEAESALREMEERTQIMLNATPLCCNLWSADRRNMSCNEEAVRLFGLSSQQEYLDFFFSLSPKYQPCGGESCKRVEEQIDKALSEGYTRFEWMHQKLDGTPIPTEITLVRIKYRSNFMVAGYTRDLRAQRAMIDELRIKEDDLRAARDEALLSSKAKSNFLANMSHEIRTPMNAISGLAELILRDNTNERTVQHARGIQAASRNLLNLINDILDISKVESGKLEVFNAPYALASLLNDVIAISKVRLGRKPLLFLTDIDSRLPAQLLGDELRIKQILINMLSNAIKFTNEGWIALQVSGTVEQGQAIVRFTVKDSGVGIQEKDVQRVFAEFERVNTTKNRSIEGTGLGLAISKRLCEMMGGSIAVESSFGQGSTFTASIPQACPSKQPLAQVEKPQRVLLYETRAHCRNSIAQSIHNLGCVCVPCANQSALYEAITAARYDYILTPSMYRAKVENAVKRNRLSVPIVTLLESGEAAHSAGEESLPLPVNTLLLANLFNGCTVGAEFTMHSTENSQFIAPTARVLVVDDSPVNLQVALGLMEPHQFVMDTAQNGLEAVEMVKKNNYDLVFMDHMMPIMDGMNATIAIRALAGAYAQALPIIALTANAIVGTRELFIRKGMNDFLAKPIEMKKLTHILLKWLPAEKVVMTSAQKEKQIEPAAPPLHPLHIEGLQVAQGILSVGGSTERYMKILSAYYIEGIQKANSFLHQRAAEDVKGFYTDIHALKSASASIGALELSLLAQRLETAAIKEDRTILREQFEPFYERFQALLQAIALLLERQGVLLQQDQAGDTRPEGELAHLKEALVALQAAATLADIGEMEEILSALQSFCWAESITEALVTIQQQLMSFAYDDVIACAARVLTQMA